MVEADSYGERQLWAAVLELAYWDAVDIPRGLQRNERNHIQAHTRAWFIAAGADYRLVCDLAGVDWRVVRAEVMNQIGAKEAA
ncbi:hypothetical protein MR829_22490 [Paracoccus versutus]|uniref:hypothetical protein n=1 Tax=Paracoccus versutus TaxID=34007 RepID=UPI001FB7EEDF|nr:hypothetical protein [Paracoccus versutus]MCJ1903104.1 hypothetical protein [Paracoccus versutus]